MPARIFQWLFRRVKDESGDDVENESGDESRDEVKDEELLVHYRVTGTCDSIIICM